MVTINHNTSPARCGGGSSISGGDPIFSSGDLWWWWGDSYIPNGPYETEEAAITACREYAEACE